MPFKIVSVGEAGMPFPLDFRCAECERISRELRAAFLIDAKEVKGRLRETAESSGRDVERFRTAWVQSVAKMPEQEMRTLLRAHYPSAIEAHHAAMPARAIRG